MLWLSYLVIRDDIHALSYKETNICNLKFVFKAAILYFVVDCIFSVSCVTTGNSHHCKQLLVKVRC